MTGLAGSSNLDRQIQFLRPVTGDPVTVLHASQCGHISLATLDPERAAVVKDAAFRTAVR